MMNSVPEFYEYGTGSEYRYQPSLRITVSSSVVVPCSDIDFTTGAVKPVHQRRRRTQALLLEQKAQTVKEKRLETAIAREATKSGIRFPVRIGAVLIAFVVLFCGTVLLAQYGKVLNLEKDITRLRNNISSYNKTNAALEAELAAAMDEAKICYAASQNLHMKPASPDNAVKLTVPVQTETAVLGQDTDSGLLAHQ